MKAISQSITLYRQGTKFQTVKEGIKCPDCLEEASDIIFSPTDDAKCANCYDQAEMMRMMQEHMTVAKPTKKEKVEVPATYKYYCPFCYDIT